MTFKLPLQLYSPRQIDAYLIELDFYLTWLREQDVKRRAKAAKADASPLTAELTSFLNVFTDNKTDDAREVEKAVIYLKRLKQHAPLVHVTFPTFASASIRESVVEWFRKNVSDEILVAFTVDTSILGGIIVRTVNNIYDYSFINRLIKDRRKFPEIMRHV